MILKIPIPSPGESVTEVAIGNWLVKDGEPVEKDQEIAEVETDKATLPLIAPESGKIKIMVKPGEKIQVGDIACTIDTGAAQSAAKVSGKPEAGRQDRMTTDQPPAPKPTANEAPAVAGEKFAAGQKEELSGIKVTPLARRKMEDYNLRIEDIVRGLKKISAGDVDLVLKNHSGLQSGKSISGQAGRETIRNPMSPLRRKLSKRLVAVKNETAMLTTFNEIDMSAVLELRKKHRQAFQEKHGIKLGLMSFFAKAATQALLLYPEINTSIDGEDIVTPSFVDLGIAVQTDKGLMVPVIRNAESLSLAGLEKQIALLAAKARENRITLEEMTGGTFTITNGGVFGSMLSTPILNPPQSAILGMHNIVERPVALQGKVEIRPIMYVALSYDHRIIDGAGSVKFLIAIKELIESPLKMLLGNDPEKDLLGIQEERPGSVQQTVKNEK